MTESTKSYEVELLPFNKPGAGSTMWRLARKFSVNEPVVLQLTKEQAEVFENDWRFKLSTSKDKGEPLEDGNVGESESVPPTAEAPTAEETVDDSDEVVEDSDVELEEETSGEDEGATELEELLRDNNRAELDNLARELGIQNPQSLSNKTEVAQAIVDAH